MTTKKRLDVYALPELAPELPPDGASVAIDVLRATTTIATALASGAEKVVPFRTVDETFAAKKAILESRPDAAGRILLGGERFDARRASYMDGVKFAGNADDFFRAFSGRPNNLFEKF